MKLIIKIAISSLLFATALIAEDEVAPAATTTQLSANEALSGIRIGGLFRVRPELKANRGFKKNPSKDALFVGQKAQVSIGKVFKDKTEVKITIQDARIWGGDSNSKSGLSTNAGISTGTSKYQESATDIREGYVNIKSLFALPLDIQIGRQILLYGDERILGGLDWSNVGRSFDGIRIRNEIKNVNKLHILAFNLQQDKDRTDDVKNLSVNTSGKGLLGIYDTIKAIKDLDIDLIFLSRLDYNNSGGERLYNSGFRITNRTNKNKLPKGKSIDYTLEAHYQFGQKSKTLVGTTETTIKYAAWALALTGGYTFKAGMKMRVGGEFTAASGDDDKTTNTVETFENLYHTNHKHYGIADLISWKNMVGTAVNFTLFPTKGMKLKVSFWNVGRYVDSDNWYTVAGTNSTVYNSANLDGRKHLYNEVDLDFGYKARDYLVFGAGYSVAFRGPALNKIGDNMGNFHFGYASTTLKF